MFTSRKSGWAGWLYYAILAVGLGAAGYEITTPCFAGLHRETTVFVLISFLTALGVVTWGVHEFRHIDPRARAIIRMDRTNHHQ